MSGIFWTIAAEPARGAAPAVRALTERIAVFIDFQNVHLVGRGLFEGGTRKNLFDLRRVAVAHNRHVITRQTAASDYQRTASLSERRSRKRAGAGSSRGLS